MVDRRLERLKWIELDACPRAYVAETTRSRLLGLAWLDDVAEGAGLLIPRCSSVHTFGMRFPLDVDFLGADREVVRRVEAVPARRLLWCRGATAVLERPARPGCRPGARGGSRAPRARGPR
jgi:uncharacterized membrane protein (UPF0127 family)